MSETKRHSVVEFYDDWCAAADVGRCDEWGGEECRRVVQEWLDAGQPEPERFIARRANAHRDASDAVTVHQVEESELPAVTSRRCKCGADGEGMFDRLADGKFKALRCKNCTRLVIIVGREHTRPPMTRRKPVNGDELVAEPAAFDERGE